MYWKQPSLGLVLPPFTPRVWDRCRCAHGSYPDILRPQVVDQWLPPPPTPHTNFSCRDRHKGDGHRGWRGVHPTKRLPGAGPAHARAQAPPHPAAPAPASQTRPRHGPWAFPFISSLLSKARAGLWALFTLHGEGEGAQLVAITRVELVLELHPGVRRESG